MTRTTSLYFLASSPATDAVSSVEPSSMMMISIGRCVWARTLSTASTSNVGRLKTGMIVVTSGDGATAVRIATAEHRENQRMYNRRSMGGGKHKFWRDTAIVALIAAAARLIFL